MDLVRDICSLGRFAREDAKIKVRQPISEVIIDAKKQDIIGDLDSVIKEELNVKNINFITDMGSYMNYEIKPNYRLVGKMFGAKIKDFAEFLTTLSHDDVERLREESINVKFDNESLELLPEMVDIKVKVKEGFCSASNSKVFVILNTNLTDELILEGIAREIIRKVQSIRKEMDLNIVDKITIYYDGNEQIDDTINKYSDYIKNETLATDIVKKADVSEKYDMNGILTELSVSKN